MFWSVKIVRYDWSVSGGFRIVWITMWGDLLRMGGLAAVGGLTAVGGLAPFTCNFSILGGLAVGGTCCAFLGGGTCCAPSRKACVCKTDLCKKGFKTDVWEICEQKKKQGLLWVFITLEIHWEEAWRSFLGQDGADKELSTVQNPTIFGG